MLVCCMHAHASAAAAADAPVCLCCRRRRARPQIVEQLLLEVRSHSHSTFDLSRIDRRGSRARRPMPCPPALIIQSAVHMLFSRLARASSSLWCTPISLLIAGIDPRFAAAQAGRNRRRRVLAGCECRQSSPTPTSSPPHPRLALVASLSSPPLSSPPSLLAWASLLLSHCPPLPPPRGKLRDRAQ